MQVIGSKTRHWHVFSGFGSSTPFYDVAYDNPKEAIQSFLMVTDALFYGHISGEARIQSEIVLNEHLEKQHNYGIFVELSPFKVMIADCDECNTSCSN